MMGRTTEQIQELFFCCCWIFHHWICWNWLWFIIKKATKNYIKNYLPSWMSSDFRNPFFLCKPWETFFFSVSLQLREFLSSKSTSQDVPCGNTVALVGVDQFILKSGTITTLEELWHDGLVVWLSFFVWGGGGMDVEGDGVSSFIFWYFLWGVFVWCQQMDMFRDSRRRKNSCESPLWTDLLLRRLGNS